MPEHDPSSQTFGLTKHERLWDRISHSRLLALLSEAGTLVRSAEVSDNSYGEFFFLTLVRRLGEQTVALPCFGLGYNEPRDRWLTDEWFWYLASNSSTAVPT